MSSQGKAAFDCNSFLQQAKHKAASRDQSPVRGAATTGAIPCRNVVKLTFQGNCDKRKNKEAVHESTEIPDNTTASGLSEEPTGLDSELMSNLTDYLVGDQPIEAVAQAGQCAESGKEQVTAIDRVRLFLPDNTRTLIVRV